MVENVGARQVGEFPLNRRQIRSPRNPLDKATIVSIYPKKIIDSKWTVQPGHFEIPAGTFDEPSTLVIGPSSWWNDNGPEQPLVEVVHAAHQMAESVINDYCTGLLACEMNTKMPGLFYVLGEATRIEIKLKYKEKLNEVQTKQRAWFQELVKLADALWSRSNHNPLVIWEEMRLAANELGLEKAWIRDYQAAEMIKCFACGGLRNPEFAVCPTCKVIDPNHPLAKDLRFAQ